MQAEVQVCEQGLQVCQGVCQTRVVVVACMVLVDVGKIVNWSTVPYAVWEVVEEVGGDRENQCTMSLGGGYV